MASESGKSNTALILGAGAVGLFLLYEYMKGKTTTATTATTAAGTTAAASSSTCPDAFAGCFCCCCYLQSLAQGL